MNKKELCQDETSKMEAKNSMLEKTKGIKNATKTNNVESKDIETKKMESKNIEPKNMEPKNMDSKNIESNKLPYTRVERKLVHQGSILDIYDDTIAFTDGHTEHWDFVSHRKGAAAVVTVLPNGKILMVRQYRNALNRETLELPAGARDDVSEDTAVCAARELEEETGYIAGKIEKLLSLKTTVAFCDELVDVYLATDLRAGRQHLDPGENIVLETYELSKLKELIFSGKIQDAKTVAGILAYDVKNQLL